MIVKEGTRERIGSKGFELFRCTLLGLNVPEFLILTMDAYMEYYRKGIDDDLSEKLGQVLNSLGGRVAVRSSSVGEDLHDHSNAGIFKTVLNVDSHDGLIKAIEEVWASAGDQNMAVIIQKQMDPDLAGVLFTRNPIDGCDETIIEYVTGGCDPLVSGKVEPSRFKVRNDVISSDNKIQGPDGVLELAPLIKTSGSMEKRFGYPLDIEWAYQDNEFHILQVRPITKVPIPDRKDSRTYSRVQAEQFYSGPVTPLFHSIFRTIYTEYYLSDTLKDIGIGIVVNEDFLIRHRNFLYVDTSIMEYALGSMPIREGLDQLWETVPQDIVDELKKEKKRSIFPMAVKVLYHIIRHRDLWIGQLDERFRKDVVPEILSKINDLEDPSKLSDQELIDSYEQIMEIVKIHVNSSKWGMILYSIPLVGIMTHLLHKNGLIEYLPDIISGFGTNRTIDASEEIDFLAHWARSNELILRSLAEDNIDYHTYRNDICRVVEGEKFIEYFENMVKIYGHRRISRDIYRPSWKDDQMIPFSIMRQLALSDAPNDRISKKEEILKRRKKTHQKIIRSLPFRDRSIFRIIFKYIVRYTEFREFQRFYLDLILDRMKDVFLEISKKSVERGVLNNIEEIFFLDIRSAFNSMNGDRSNRTHEMAMFNRISYDDETATPGKYLRNGVDFDTVSQVKKCSEPKNGRELIGQGVAAGNHGGKVHVLRDLDSKVKINKGDVLVTRYIDPGQTHLFLMAGALVLEVGGMLSHGAILAREFNIPTVAGVKNATDLLKNDQSVVVNGSYGTVTIL